MYNLQVIGVVDVILTLNSYSTSYATEILFCGMVILAFLFSLVFFLYGLIGFDGVDSESVHQVVR